MPADISLITRLVVELLSAKSPEPGARLMQRLNLTLKDSSFDRLDLKAFGYRRFKDFLRKELGDVITLDLPNGPGDIVVHLKKSSSEAPVHTATVEIADVTNTFSDALDTPTIRNDVWQAFVNTDSSRRRFFDRSTGRVIHFTDKQAHPEQSLIQRNPALYAEVKPISEGIQTDWMQQFLKLIEVPESLNGTLSLLLSGAFSPRLSDAFRGALGTKLGSAWVRYRARQIYEQVNAWADQNQVDIANLILPHRESPIPVVQAFAAGGTPHLGYGARDQVMKMMASISDEDIVQIVLPFLASAIYIKSRSN